MVAAVMAVPAQAVLQRTGPVEPSHGFPKWYQDATGLALEFCAPTTASDLVAGLCAVLPGIAPDGLDPNNLPEVFPGNFSLEHFYYLLTTTLPTSGLDKKSRLPVSGAGRFVFVNGLEATFNTPVPEAGQQITFNRWRARMDNLACSGNFTFYTPSRAPKTVAGVAGGRIADTEDIGIGPGFDGALTGSVGPFFLRATIPGGAASPLVRGADGKQYLSAGDLGSITGSLQTNPFKGSTLAYIPPEIRAMATTNYVMVVGPGVLSGNCASTEAAYAISNLQVLGRINSNPIPTRTNVDRATYRALDSNGDGVPDRFQIGGWAHAVQEVGRPEPVLGLSLNKGDPADAANTTPEVAMIKLGVAAPAAAPGTVATPRFIYFNGVVQPAVSGRISPAYTHAKVRTTTDSPATSVNVPLVDELRVVAANYNATTKVLTVTADSGALLGAATPAATSAGTFACSDPCLTLDNDGLPEKDAAGVAIDYKMKIAQGAKTALASITIPNVITAPAYVTVRSSAGGWDRQQVMYLGAAAGTAVFQPDSVSTQMNLPVLANVLANDVGVAAVPNLLICTAATGGTCGLPSAIATCIVGTASSSCTAQGGRLAIANNIVTYTPRANVGGIADSFYYQAATVLGGTLRQKVTVNIGALNGLPDARDDLGNAAVVGRPLTINVTANDFAVAGVDRATMRLTVQPFNQATGVPAPGSAVFVDDKLVFTPPAAGAWQMSYTFTDRVGMVADPGVVTVNAVGTEVITIQRARWTLPRAPNLGTLAVNGTDNIAQGQILQLWIPAAGTVGCTRPGNAAGGDVPIGQVVVGAGGAYDFGAIPLATRPTAVYVYSADFGGCTQVNVQ